MAKNPKILVKMAEELVEAKQNEMNFMVDKIMEDNPGTSKQDATNVYLLNQIIAIEVQLASIDADLDEIFGEDETSVLN